jgi:hypothetical protein
VVVYIVVLGHDTEYRYDIEKVFDTRDKAEEYIRKNSDPDWTSSLYDIIEEEVE